MFLLLLMIQFYDIESRGILLSLNKMILHNGIKLLDFAFIVSISSSSYEVDKSNVFVTPLV